MIEAFDPEECKDEEGNWTRWVIARMTVEQLAQFNEMKEILSHEEPPLDRLSDNHIMRFM